MEIIGYIHTDFSGKIWNSTPKRIGRRTKSHHNIFAKVQAERGISWLGSIHTHLASVAVSQSGT